MSKIFKKEIIITCAIFIILLFIFSTSTSPLYNLASSGNDAYVFRLIGRGILSGHKMYVDLFDHKGPVLFFLEAFACLFGDYGIFFIQCLFGIISIICLIGIRDIVVSNGIVTPSPKSFYIVTIFTMFSFFITFDGGGYTEELTLVFNIIPVLLFVKYAINVMKNGIKKHPVLYSYIYGICFGIIAYIRINNAICICAFSLVIIIFLLINKQFINILSNILFGILGIITISLPIFIYFYSIDAIEEMIYATFLHNIKYAMVNAELSATAFYNSFSLKSIEEYFAFFYKNIRMRIVLVYTEIFLCIVNLIDMRKNKRKITILDCAMIVMVILNTINVIMADKYIHYMVNTIPVFALTLLLYLDYIKHKNLKKGFIAILSFILCIYMILNVCNIVTHYEENNREQKLVKENFNIIPINEKNSVLGYNIEPKYYIYANIIPCYKYYTMQDWWSKVNPQINVDYINYLEKFRPTWFITAKRIDNPKVQEIIDKYYTFVKEDDYLKMYKAK